MIEIYKALFDRELTKLSNEIQAFQLESNLWVVQGKITNSAGNLCLHLVGNLNAFIGQKLGGTSYVRDRKFEFEGKGVSRADLHTMIEETKGVIARTFENLKEDDLSAPYPEQVMGFEMTMGYFIAHLLSHFSYHLGQINYLRRMLAES